MAQKYTAVFIVILYYFVISLCQETRKDLTARGEYVQIFSSIPKLFEYLLDMLEKRPEILEDNHSSAFMELDVQRIKRDSDLQALDKEVSNEGTDKDENSNVVVVTERHEYGNSIVKIQRTKKSPIINEKNVDVIKMKRSNDFGESNFAPTNTMSNVSPEEVEEMALKVEKELEERLKNRLNRDLK